MEYLLMIHSDPSGLAALSPGQQQEALAAYGAYTEALAQAGVLKGGNRLRRAQASTVVRVRDGQTHVQDGPFIDTKELIGGWAILKADSREEILRLSAEFMELHGRYWPEFEGECEVRPIDFMLSDAHGAR